MLASALGPALVLVQVQDLALARARDLAVVSVRELEVRLVQQPAAGCFLVVVVRCQPREEAG